MRRGERKIRKTLWSGRETAKRTGRRREYREEEERVRGILRVESGGERMAGRREAEQELRVLSCFHLACIYGSCVQTCLFCFNICILLGFGMIELSFHVLAGIFFMFLILFFRSIPVSWPVISHINYYLSGLLSRLFQLISRQIWQQSIFFFFLFRLSVCNA